MVSYIIIFMQLPFLYGLVMVVCVYGSSADYLSDKIDCANSLLMCGLSIAWSNEYIVLYVVVT